MNLAWLGWFLITLFVSLWTTRVVIRAAKKHGVIDQPGEERKIHKSPIPGMGGLAIFFAFSVTLILILASIDVLTS